MVIAVLGSGSWGGALANHLSKNTQNKVILWGRDPEQIKEINKSKRNPKYNSDLLFTGSFEATTNLSNSLSSAELVLAVIPSKSFFEIIPQIKASYRPESYFVSAIKGLEPKTQKTILTVVKSELKLEKNFGVLSGPSFSREVLAGLPTALTLAAPELPIAKQIAAVFHHENIRVYTSTDVMGVEIGGTFKNILALATGILDGLELGANARAALITRGLQEMRRVVLKLGGLHDTVTGLSGLGDLVLTATSELSRNRTVGFRLGRGESLTDILKGLSGISEAVDNAKLFLELAHKHQIDLPITEAVCKILYEGVAPLDVAKILMNRAMKTEIET